MRLPKECQVTGNELGVFRDGQRLVLEPINKRGWSQAFLDMISMPAPMELFPAREQPPPQDRDFDS